MESKSPTSKIKIIGTSHIAKQSICEVKNKILKEKPDIVCVELDRARFLSLFCKKQKTGLKTLKVGGFGAIFVWIGRWIQKKLGEHVGIVPGADMKSAILSAQSIGAKVYLIDIPINQTLQKLSREVPAVEKWKLVLYILFSPLSKKTRRFAKIDLTKVPAQALIENLISDMRSKFPNIFRVLLDDRNQHMAKTLKIICKNNPNKKVFAIVGAGHKSGLKELLAN